MLMTQCGVMQLLGSMLMVGQVPEALERGIMQRMAFKTAYFQYDREKRAPDTGIMMQCRFEVRMAGDDAYWINHGDQDGILLKNYNTGQPILNVRSACTPKHTVRCRGSDDQWLRHDG